MRTRCLSTKIFPLLLLSLLIMSSFLVQAKALTWSVKKLQFTTSTFVDGYPAIMQTQDKRIWIVYSKEMPFLGSMALYYNISSNLGKTWSQETNLTDQEAVGHAQNPAIMQASNGTIWVTWTSDVTPPQPPVPDFTLTAVPQNLTIQQGNTGNSTIVVTSLIGFTETITFSVLEPPVGVTTSFNPHQVTPPPNGQVNSTLTVSVNATAPPGNYTFSVVGKGTSQTHTVDVNLEITTAGTLGYRVMASTLAQSSVTPTALEDYEVYYKTSRDNGVSWSNDLMLTNNLVDDLRPSITQLLNGTIMIVWQSLISGNHDIWYKTTTDGISWSNATQLTIDPARDQAPAVIQASDGKIWVAWSSNRLGSNDIFYKIYNGTTWSDEYLLSLAASVDSEVQADMIQAIDGAVMIFWASNTTGNYDIYYANTTDNGLHWSNKTTLVASNYDDMWPAVMKAQDTKMWIAWMSNEANQPDGNFEIYATYSLPGDINGDGLVDAVDLGNVAFCYGASVGEQFYNRNMDINKDGFIDMEDIWVIAYYIDET